MPAKQRGLSCRERPGVAYKTHTSRRKTQRCPSTDTQADSPSPGVLPWAGSPSSIKGRGWLVIDLLESLLRNSFLGPLLQKNWKWGEFVHLHFPQTAWGTTGRNSQHSVWVKSSRVWTQGAPESSRRNGTNCHPMATLGLAPLCPSKQPSSPQKSQLSGKCCQGCPLPLVPKAAPQSQKGSRGPALPSA